MAPNVSTTVNHANVRAKPFLRARATDNARSPTAAIAAPMITGWMMVPNGRPRVAASVTRSPSSVGTPRKLSPSTPPVRHCNAITTTSMAANTPSPSRITSTWRLVLTRMAT